MNKDLVAIFEYLEREKGIKRDIIIDAIEESLKVAARKSMKGLINISVQINPKTGHIDVTAQKEVVDLVTIPEEEISLEDARIINPQAEINDWIDITVTPDYFGRIAAQTARQIISQKLRTAERDVIYEEYRHRLSEIISGTVKRIIRGTTLIVDLGKVEGILPERNYPKTERYNIGDRVQALLLEVKDTDNGGAEVVLSRSHPEFVKQLFAQEVPEIGDDTIVIERIAREAGYRTKMAVRSNDPKVDPVGATVGVRGARIKNIIRELNNEKIDVIPFVEDRIQLLENALHPIQMKKYTYQPEIPLVSIVVADEDYPNVLGKRGINIRLLSQLIDAALDVQKQSEYDQTSASQRAEIALLDDPTLDAPLHIEGMSSMIVDSLVVAGFDTIRKLLKASAKDLAQIPEISLEMADRILEEVRKKRK